MNAQQGNPGVDSGKDVRQLMTEFDRKEKVTPTVSIVTPSFNQGRFIEETILSVLTQKGDFLLEYIIRDGGSTDNTVAVIRKYEQLLKEKKIPLRCKGIDFLWTSERDKGQADAINQGFRTAKGEILAWLNSDDTYAPGAVAKALECFAKDPEIAFIYGDCFYTDESMEKKNYFSASSTVDLARFVCGEGRGLVQPTVFVKREAAARAGFLNEKLYFTLDQDWFIRIARNFKGRYVPFAFANDRLHGAAKTFDRLFPAYLAEVLLLGARYGGEKIFLKHFSSGVAEMSVKKKISAGDAFKTLKDAVLSRKDIYDVSLIPPRVFSRAFGFAMLKISLETAGKDRKGSLRHLIRAVKFCPPCVFSPEFYLAVTKWLLPGRFYDYAKRFLSGMAGPGSLPEAAE